MAEVPVTPISIIASMSDAAVEPGWKGRPDADGPTTVPEPSTRPSEHAQWDESRGCWIEWDGEAEAWVQLPDHAAGPDDEDIRT
jgi:hypothetical protein